jgi:superfamily II DNA or RNA helicase
VAGRVSEFLGVKPGQLGGGRAKLRGTIDIATLQTLARRTDVGALTASYGLMVADECHHVPAVPTRRHRTARGPHQAVARAG